MKTKNEKGRKEKKKGREKTRERERTRELASADGQFHRSARACVLTRDNCVSRYFLSGMNESCSRDSCCEMLSVSRPFLLLFFLSLIAPRARRIAYSLYYTGASGAAFFRPGFRPNSASILTRTETLIKTQSAQPWAARCQIAT